MIYYLICLYLFCSVEKIPGNMKDREAVAIYQDDIPTEPHSLSSDGQKSHTIRLQWSPPLRYKEKICYYEIKYSQSGKIKWYTQRTEDDSCELVLKRLKSDTEYQIRVRGITNEAEGYFSKISSFTTNLSLAKMLVNELTFAKSDRFQNENPVIYKLPVTEDTSQRNNCSRTRKCNFGKIDWTSHLSFWYYRLFVPF